MRNESEGALTSSEVGICGFVPWRHYRPIWMFFEGFELVEKMDSRAFASCFFT